MDDQPYPDDLKQVDPKRYRRSLEQLTEIFRGISETVNVVSSYRCPYKNVQDRCIAQFGCRNQDRTVSSSELYPCTGDDNLDYRAAWEN